MRILLLLVTIAIAVSGCQTVPGGNANIFSGGRVAIVGKPLKLERFYAINPDCSSLGSTTIRVISGPQHGTISQRDEADFPYFVNANPRSACNRRRVPTRQLWYTASTPGMSESIVVEVIYVNGAARNFTFKLTTQ